MQSPVLATVELSVRLSVTRWQTTQSRITKSSSTGSSRCLVLARKSSSRYSKGVTPSEGVKWECGSKNSQFSANKSSYPRNGARWTKVPIGSRICLFDWCQNQRPWMTLTADMHSIAEKMRLSETIRKIWMKIDAYCQRRKRRLMTQVSGDIKFVGIRRGSIERKHQTTLGSRVMCTCCGRMLKFIRCVCSKLARLSDVGFGADRRRCRSLRV